MLRHEVNLLRLTLQGRGEREEVGVLNLPLEPGREGGLLELAQACNRVELVAISFCADVCDWKATANQFSTTLLSTTYRGQIVLKSFGLESTTSTFLRLFKLTV